MNNDNKNNNKKQPAKITIKRSGRLYVFSQIKEGKTPSDIIKESIVPERSIWRYIKELKAMGCIEKVGYGVWNALKQPAKITITHSKSIYKEIRGHAFIFNILLPKITNWKLREDFLVKNNIPFKKIHKHTQSIIFRGHKVWLSDKSITIYSPKEKSYFQKTAQESEDYSIEEFKSLIRGLENMLGNISFEINKQYRFRVARHHFARVKDALAIQCNKDKTKIKIKLNNGWFVIDNSLGLNEAETQGQDAIKYQNIYQNFIKSLMDKPFTAYDFNAVYDVLMKYTAQMDLHLNVETKTGETLEKINEAIKKLTENFNKK